jgi:hypothetical protein
MEPYSLRRFARAEEHPPRGGADEFARLSCQPTMGITVRFNHEEGFDSCVD